MIACSYGVDRYFRGQDAMVTHVQGMKYKDSFFPAASSSLFWQKFVRDQNDAEKVFKTKVEKWSRPSDMHSR